MAKQTIEHKYGWVFLNYKLKKNVENVDPVQLETIVSGKIPGYLKVATERKKDRVTNISYDITECTRLGEFLASHVMYRKLFVSIALEMVDALITCGKRHLVYSYIMTDYNEIFIDKNRLEIKFQYYPLVGIGNNESMVEFLRKFPDYCFFAPQEQTSYIKEYVGYLSNLRKPFNIFDFRTFLVQLDDEIAKKYNEQNTKNSVEKEPIGQDFTGNKNSIYANQDGDYQKLYITPISLASGGQNNVISGTDIVSRFPGVSNVAPNPAAASFFSDAAPRPAVAPVAPNAAPRPAVAPVAPNVAPNLAASPFGKEVSDPIGSKTTIPPESQSFLNNSSSRQNYPKQEPKSVLRGAQVSSYGESKTTILGMAQVDDGTTPLNSSYSPNADLSQKRATMTRLRTGEERVINKDIFLIGKNATQVDFVITDNTTISRTHATISRKGGRFFLKDNHSLNGTYVNGDIVQEHDEIELLNGTKILLSDEEFIFGIEEMVKKYE